jgi:hypothetical protein
MNTSIILTQDNRFPGFETKMDMRFGTWHVRRLRKIGWDDMAWNDLAQDRDQWQALVNKVMNLWVS